MSGQDFMGQFADGMNGMLENPLMDYLMGRAPPGVFAQAQAAQAQAAQAQAQAQAQGAQSPAAVPPPAALSYINSLRETQVTGDDLIEENNKECLICLDDHELGGKAVKLPCGHLYHKPCISEWLNKQGSCPVCRYEVESSDIMYERQRKYRMNATRKLRMRRDELKAKKIPELRQIARQLSVDISKCIDKKEITDLLFSHEDKFDFTEGVPIQKIDEDAFQKKSVKELRELLLSFGISDQGMLNKDELRDALVESGRIELVRTEKKGDEGEGKDEEMDEVSEPEPTPALKSPRLEGGGADSKMEIDVEVETNQASSDDPAWGMPSSPLSPASPPAPAPAPAPAPTPGNANVLELGMDVVKSMSIRELKSIMGAYSISTEGCIERDDLLRRLDDHPGVSLLED